MARKYINPNRPSAFVSDAALGQARERVSSAAERLRAVEAADPSRPGWDAGYDAATSAVRAAERRLEALESLRARQVERGGKRDAAVKASAAELEGLATGLAASRDAVAAAAREHLRALAALASAVAAHNSALAAGRARVATLGLAVRDDLVDEGAEHPEGTLDSGGLRCGGTDWTPVPAGAVEAHALRAVFAGYGLLHPLAQVGKYLWRPHQVEARADQLELPDLKAARALLPPEPPQAAPARMAQVERQTPPDRTPDPVTGFYREEKRLVRMGAR